MPYEEFHSSCDSPIFTSILKRFGCCSTNAALYTAPIEIIREHMVQ